MAELEYLQRSLNGLKEEKLTLDNVLKFILDIQNAEEFAEGFAELDVDSVELVRKRITDCYQDLANFIADFSDKYSVSVPDEKTKSSNKYKRWSGYFSAWEEQQKELEKKNSENPLEPAVLLEQQESDLDRLFSAEVLRKIYAEQAAILNVKNTELDSSMRKLAIDMLQEE